MEPGTLLFDPATDRVGEYQDHCGPYARLRPVGGGREWQADPAALRPPTDGERLSAGVRAANDRARTAVPAPAAPTSARPATDGPFLLADPPRPVAGCETCGELADARATAQGSYDRSAESDANVLFRKHRREAHSA